MTNAERKVIITIIIPSYNSAAFIGNALDKIIEQNFSSYEVLVMDNQSTDDTARIVRQKQDDRIILHSSKDRGIYDAMNKGIELAQGEWLFFMGADDSFVNNTVLEKVAIHLKAANDIVYGDVNWTPNNAAESGEWDLNTLINQNINHQRIFYRKYLFQKFGGYNIRYRIASDYELNIRFFCNHTIKKKYIPVTISNYHSGGFSSNQTDEKFWEDWNKTVYCNFRHLLSRKTIYLSLGGYCRYLIDKRNYSKAIFLAVRVFAKTSSFGFINLMLQYFLKSGRSRTEI